MKEATGELNMTVITVVAIAAVAAFFYAFVWPNIKNSIDQSTVCSNSWDCHDCDGKTCKCTVCPDGGFNCSDPKTDFKCPDKTGTATTTPGGTTPP